MTKFKKITAVVSSVLMAGLTIGSAAAANYPAPFVDDGVANAAVVYGTGAGVSSLDQVQAGNIQQSLATYVEGTSTVEGGEVFALEKSSNNMNFGDSIASVYPNLDDDEMPETLKEGTYDDGDVDTEYTQEISLADKTLKIFSNRDYNDEEVTIGYEYIRNDEVLNYTMDLDDDTLYTALKGTDMPLMGNEYYVLEAAENKLELLDSASTAMLSGTETVTVEGKTVEAIIGDGWVKFTVDGESTAKLADGETEELSDGTWIVAKEILYLSKEGTSSKVEFTIGSDKLVLENEQEVEMNEEDVDGLYAHFNGDADNLDAITLQWTADDDMWLTEEDSMVMPGFETVKLVFGGMDFPESERITFDAGKELTLNLESFDIPILRTNGTHIVGYGTDYEPLVVSETATSISLEEGDRFLATIMPTSQDLSDAETRYYEVTSIENDTSSGDILVEFEDLIGDNDLSLDDTDETDDGDFTFSVDSVVDRTSAALTIGSSIGVVSMNKIVTEKGLVITIPVDTFDENSTSLDLTLAEADKDENLESISNFTVTVGVDETDEELHISGIDSSIATLETTSDDVLVGYVESDLATKVLFDKSSDLNDLEVEYYGKEVTADVSIASSDAKVSTTSALGEILLKDSEVSNSDAESFIIVGGSCINSAAADVLGGEYCGAAFTEATGVSNGEFLIKGVEDGINGKFSLVVAGYEAADTANAATFLTKKDVDTSKTYKGTSETEATLVTETN